MNSDSKHAATADVIPGSEQLPPAFGGSRQTDIVRLRHLVREAVRGWLSKTPSEHTRKAYSKDLSQFLDFHGIDPDSLEELVRVVPASVSRWRDSLRERGASNATIRRKLTALRSLFSYLQIYGYTGANPAHGKFVKAPAVARDGKTVGLSPSACRRLLDAPDPGTPSGIRDRAILAVLAYTACRVGEIVRLRVADFKVSGEHRVLAVYGKGGKERVVPLHVEASERLADWFQTLPLGIDRNGPLFRPSRTPRGKGWDGFLPNHLSTRAVQRLVRRYADQSDLDPAVTVHSLRVTALTTARERGADIIGLQNFAGHADPRTTLTYIRTRDRLSKSPAYVIHYQ